MNFKKITEKAVNIANDWKPTIVKGLKLTVGILATALAKSGLEKVGINLDLPTVQHSRNESNLLYFPKAFDATTITEKKMYSIYTGAMKDNDWWKVRGAEDIFELVDESLSDSEKNFATDLLSELASSVSDRYYRTRITDILKEM